MGVRRVFVEIDPGRCTGCGFCTSVNRCYSPGECIGCLSCFYACPYGARVLRYRVVEPRTVEVVVDGVRYSVPSGISIVRRHLDSNGTLLTPDYIDELVEAGCNNIGVEPKCLHVETYMRITGIMDRDLARKYLETSWEAIEYIYENYSDKVYLGIGLVYNKALVSMDEIAEAGSRIASIDPEIQVTVLDYFPAFRRRDLERPTVEEMLMVKRVLEDQGLKTVIVQTEIGHVGPRSLG